MRVVHISTFDRGNGASEAAYRLHCALRSNGVDSWMAVQNKLGDDPFVVGPETKVEKLFSMLRPYLDGIPKSFGEETSDFYNDVSWLPTTQIKWIKKLNADIIHLHWINGGFISIGSLKQFKKPIVWTCHDVWPLSGIRHYPVIKFDGDKPLVSDDCSRELSRKGFLNRWVINRKVKVWKRLNMTAVAPSSWMERELKKSLLWTDRKIRKIPNGIDLSVFKPIDKIEAKKILNLPLDKKFILFGAMSATTDHRKGYFLLKEAITKINDQLKDVELLVYGSSSISSDTELGVTTHYAGRLRDVYSLVLFYSAADLFLAPSLQDNLPNTVVESLSCGTPCVSFNIGGLPDMIEHKKNGYLAKPFEVDDLSEGILWTLKHGSSLREYSRKCAVDKFSDNDNAKKMHDLYKEVV